MKFLCTEKLSSHRFKTPEGYLICTDAILARTGKQSYLRKEVFGDQCDNGEVEIEVDRPYNEVFSKETLASFENKPVTVEHPDENVNCENWKEYQVGFVRDIKQGKSFTGEDIMTGTLVIQDADTINEIERGEHTEISCGYDCDVDDIENPYQKNIRGNHIALCQQGRAGIARIIDSNGKIKEVKDIQATKVPGADKIIYVMQSDIDKNLYFYIGKTFSMKEGSWGYTKFEMGEDTPEKIKAELTRNGWHQVASDPAKIIDVSNEEKNNSTDMKDFKKDILNNDEGTRVYQCKSGYVIVLKRYYDRYKKYAYIERRADDLDEARNARQSLESSDRLEYVIVDCNNGKYNVVDSRNEYKIKYKDSKGNCHIRIVNADSIISAVKKVKKDLK